MVNQPRSINAVNDKILKMVNGLDEDDNFKDVIKGLIAIELQNMDKDKVTYTKEYEKVFSKYLMSD